MSWLLRRWVWQLDSPVFIGMPPAGTLNRCRLWVPGRVLWGALTAELARRENEGFPDYERVGEEVRKYVRFTYLYPAGRSGNSWQAWLPAFENRPGLVWRREDAASSDAGFPDRRFRQHLLDARPGTAVEPCSDTAEEGSLRETECILPRWRSGPQAGERVAFAGYVFVNQDFAERLARISVLHLGGDTRYGLGRVRRIKCEEANDVFGKQVGVTDETAPVVRTPAPLGHALVKDDKLEMTGDRECLAGWNVRGQKGLSKLVCNAALWVPGSTTSKDAEEPVWAIDEDGLWTRQPAEPVS